MATKKKPSRLMLSISGENINNETIPYLPFRITTTSVDELAEGAKHVIKHILPSWNNTKVELIQCTDGLTNKLFKVTGPVPLTDSSSPIPSSNSALIRIYGEKTEVLIDRNQEVRTMQSLAKEGMAAPLYGRFENGIVYGYTEGSPLSLDQMKDASVFPLVATKVAQIHSLSVAMDNNQQVVELRSNASLFPTMRNWLQKTPTSLPKPDQNKQLANILSFISIANEIDWLESKILASDETGRVNGLSKIGFCHNDLLAGNIIIGPKKKSVHFIDFEYGTYNYREFDIGNHFCEMLGLEVNIENYPSEKLQKEWLTSYLVAAKKFGSKEVEGSKEEVEVLFGRVKQFCLAAHLFWGTWALVQALYSDISSFDYVNYSFLRFLAYSKQKQIFFP